MLSIVLGSRRSRRGLRGGGGPGLSDTLRGYKVEAILEARWRRTGWLANRRGDGCLISTSFSEIGSLTGNSSCDSGICGNAVIELSLLIELLVRAWPVLNVRFAACSIRLLIHEFATETAGFCCGVG